MASIQDKGPWFGMRHVQAFLIFLAIVSAFVGRYNVAVAVVAMTRTNTNTNTNTTIHRSDISSVNSDFPVFDWDEKITSYILSSFFWGYTLTQFPGGAMTKRFGAKITLLTCILGSAVLSAVTPIAIQYGDWKAFCAIRMFQGLFQGLLFPSLCDHLAKWSPLEERNRLGALSHSGIDCGTVLALSISGSIIAGPMGWPGLSYVSAIIGFVWCLLWLVFAYNNPDESRFISEAEKRYIQESLTRSSDYHSQKIPTPWKAIACSVPFAVSVIARCTEIWGYSTMQHQIPSYLNGVFQMDIKNNSLFSALPFLAMWIGAYLFAFAADLIRSKNWLSLTALRRTVNTISTWLPAAGLVAIGFLEAEQQTLAIILMTISVGINSGSIIGVALNTIDLSPNHAGILMGISNTMASAMPIFSPLLVGMIVKDSHDRFQWQIVFIITALIFFVGNLIYIIWGSTKTQAWDAPDYLKSKNIESGRKLTTCCSRDTNTMPCNSHGNEIYKNTIDDS